MVQSSGKGKLMASTSLVALKVQKLMSPVELQLHLALKASHFLKIPLLVMLEMMRALYLVPSKHYFHCLQKLLKLTLRSLMVLKVEFQLHLALMAKIELMTLLKLALRTQMGLKV